MHQKKNELGTNNIITEDIRLIKILIVQNTKDTSLLYTLLNETHNTPFLKGISSTRDCYLLSYMTGSQSVHNRPLPGH